MEPALWTQGILSIPVRRAILRSRTGLDEDVAGDRSKRRRVLPVRPQNIRKRGIPRIAVFSHGGRNPGDGFSQSGHDVSPLRQIGRYRSKRGRAALSGQGWPDFSEHI